MASSSDILVLVTPHSTAVAQVQGNRVVTMREQARTSNDFVHAIESALDLSSVRPARTWLLATDVWSQPVAIQADIARRVPPAQLAQFVCFEVEPLSGISPRQGIAGVEPLAASAGDPTYWVSEVDRSIFEQLQGLIASRGGRLMGLLHPAGAGGALLDRQAAQWRRLEFWPDMIVCLAGRGRQVERHIVARDMLSGDSVAEALRWMEDRRGSQHDEVLVASADAAAQQAAQSLGWRLLSAFEGASACLTAWAAALPKLSGAPRIVPSRQGLPARTKKLISVAATVVTVTGCVMGYQVWSAMNQTAVRSLQSEAEALRGPTKLAEEARKAIEKQTAELKDIEKRETALAGAIADFQTSALHHKHRVPELLEVLAEACGDDVLVQGIESDGRQMKIFGRCLDARRANDVASALADRLAPLGLVVSLPDKSATYRTQDGAPHDFEFTIVDKRL